ncbi:heavy metal translocating P-type ATPase [Niabella hibiscisoli]|uniref:heavy metal translocating P-type ATPase n=1 Tax=Niabella hibiscisoli TaxID=1825928 RepID=UPI001F0D4CE0|nr:cation-translocating P-type ATPase [Niabella hibiscisoli]MCH5715192.1 cadmium-translocating P-type ATPase [Niabella hibiscisoli]
MDCATCALTINKYLNKEGAKDVKVNFATGAVSFENNSNLAVDKITKGLADLGYTVAGEASHHDHAHGHNHENSKTGFLKNNAQRFWFCLPFTLILMLHMIPALHHSWIMQPYVQLALSLPVYIVGISFFGVSAWKSIRNGMLNMNVLIAIGATAAFVYSLYGTLTGQDAYIFYETAATVITLVFLGNFIEEKAVDSTQAQLKKLSESQVVMANMIAYDNEHNENVFPVETSSLRTGDLILIKSGEQVPTDCKILWGDVSVNEAIITGESAPVQKGYKQELIGGSVVTDGTVKAQVTAVGKDTVLAGIINMVQEAQGEKPPVQQMADKISAIFIPVVLGIAAITLAANWIILKEFTPALMRAIAVLVIACPCAMGLATPAAIAVGLGRGARNGILFRNATSLENFKNIKQVVFDKTGTLTTGQFAITDYTILDNRIDEPAFQLLVYSMEKYSNHPIAKALIKEWKTKGEIRWQKVEEIKGEGMRALDKAGNEYRAGSYKIAAHLTKDDSHNIYVLENNTLIGYINVADELRPEAKQVVSYFHNRGIKTVLLSGDKQSKAQHIANTLGIDEVIAEKTPEQKLQIIAQKNAETPTAMVGDGINDAPALAKATIGISMSDASQIAMQTAQVVLMNHGLKNLPMALGLGRHTYKTIKENLFWAFSYNIIAIPIAALGFLTPSFGALIMAFSDVVLAANSSRLLVKKVD